MCGHYDRAATRDERKDVYDALNVYIEARVRSVLNSRVPEQEQRVPEQEQRVPEQVYRITNNSGDVIPLGSVLFLSGDISGDIMHSGCLQIIKQDGVFKVIGA